MHLHSYPWINLASKPCFLSQILLCSYGEIHHKPAKQNLDQKAWVGDYDIIRLMQLFIICGSQQTLKDIPRDTVSLNPLTLRLPHTSCHIHYWIHSLFVRPSFPNKLTLALCMTCKSASLSVPVRLVAFNSDKSPECILETNTRYNTRALIGETRQLFTSERLACTFFITPFSPLFFHRSCQMAYSPTALDSSLDCPYKSYFCWQEACALIRVSHTHHMIIFNPFTNVYGI